MKKLLIEKERQAYIEDKIALAAFYDDVLTYVIELEEKVNARDRKIEDLKTRIKGVKNGPANQT
jgi:hypothetical protein